MTNEEHSTPSEGQEVLSKVHYVYLISCTFTERVYIGVSYRPKRRLWEHFRRAKREKSTTMLHRTMRAHPEKSFAMTILSEHPNEDEAFKEEIRLIADYRSRNVPLFNLTDGGDGVRGDSEELFKRRSQAQLGRKMSEESKEKNRRAHLGVPKPESHRQKLRERKGPKHPHYGKKIHSEEQKEKWSKERKGRKIKPRTQEQKENMSASRIAKGIAAGTRNPHYKGDKASKRTIASRHYSKNFILAANSDASPADYL